MKLYSPQMSVDFNASRIGVFAPQTQMGSRF